MINVQKLKKADLLAAAELVGHEFADGATVDEMRDDISESLQNLHSDGSDAGLTEEQMDRATSISELVGMVEEAEGSKADANDFQESSDLELEARQKVAEDADAQAASALGASDEDGFEEVAQGEGGEVVVPKAKGKTKKIKIGKWENIPTEDIFVQTAALADKKGLERPAEDLDRDQLIAKYAELKSAKKPAKKKDPSAPRAGRTFSIEQVHQIRRARLIDHKAFPVIGQEFGCSAMLARNIVVGNLYKDVPFEVYTEEEMTPAPEAEAAE